MSADVTVAAAMVLPAPTITNEVTDGDIRRYWFLDVDEVRAVTVSTVTEAPGVRVVEVRVERGSSDGSVIGRWSGVHARTGTLTPDDAERLGRCLLAAAADARVRSGASS